MTEKVVVILRRVSSLGDRVETCGRKYYGTGWPTSASRIGHRVQGKKYSEEYRIPESAKSLDQVISAKGFYTHSLPSLKVSL